MHQKTPGEIIAFCAEGQVYDLTRKGEFQEQKTTPVSRTSTLGLDVLRHTAAHILAQAVKRLFPEVQVTIGPVIENGFYYDFLAVNPFQEDDLKRIKEEMERIVQEDLPITRHEWPRDKAIAYFRDKGEPFKAEIIAGIPQDQAISVYAQGDFLDLCRGPHLPSTGDLGKGVKLTKVSGAYWKGDSQGQPLQRIYGTTWASEEDLKKYLECIEEAEKRDHRKIGKQMGLFHFQPEAPGSVFWHPDGWTLYRQLRQYVRDQLDGYQEVNTPQLVSQSLWQASGHWDVYRDKMFSLTHNEQLYALKPMNCPCHVQIFKQGMKSYRDLPIRLAEFGSCMRDEPSGSLAGLMRLRHFVQDDAHIFCTPEQIEDETKAFCSLLQRMYRELGFQDILVRLALRPEARLGEEALWDRAEESLAKGATAAGLEYELNPGEGAFYGPKLEFTLKDSLGRCWQCGTLQVDFVLPSRLGASYTAADGQNYPVVMLHRAVLGSFERFMGVLIEHYAGDLPLWLAPVQAVVATVSDKSMAYGNQVLDALKAKGIRAAGDFRGEKIGHKIREHILSKAGCIIVVGERDEKNGTVNIRKGQKDHTGPLHDIVKVLQDTIEFKKIFCVESLAEKGA